MASVPSAGGSGLFKFLKPRARPQSDDIQAAAMWGVAAATTALYLIQPFDWLKKTFFEKPEPEAVSVCTGFHESKLQGRLGFFLTLAGTRRLAWADLELEPLFVILLR